MSLMLNDTWVKELSGLGPEGSNPLVSKLSIPFGLAPEGTKTPIEEAKRKSNYYRCPECGEFLNPRIGAQRQYFAHKQGVLEDTSCSLSSDEGVEKMIEDLRTSDI